MFRKYIMNQYNFGKDQETIVYQKLLEKFPNLKQTKGKWDSWDFYDDNVFIELKSRKCSSNQYNSTLIGSNKITNGEYENNNNKLIYYFFNFKDKLMFWKYQPNIKFNQRLLYGKWNSEIPFDILNDF